MHSRFSLAAFSGLVLLAVTIATPRASAQPGVDIFVTPVPDAPFTAVVRVERTTVRHDGSIFNLKSMRDIARDGRGRIHNEGRALVPASSTETPPLLHIHLYDPQTRISTMLDPPTRTFRKQTLSHPPSTVPPTVRYASPSEAGLPQNDFSKEEDLGTQEIEGVLAHGVRETQTIPAESSDTGEGVVVTDEYWYSDELRINVLIKHTDPRTGTVTIKVTQITRGEPDAALFEIPADYTPAEPAKKQ
jgi:hypothetical protein